MRAVDLKVAAALADLPARPVRLPEEADPDAIVRALVANQVPLLEIPEPAERLSGAAAWRQAVSGEAGARSRLLAQFEAVARPFREAGIETVLFKSAGGFPYRSSNLDLLVRPARMDQAAGILEDAGHLRLPHYREEHKLLYRRFVRGASVICVHLHEAVNWGRVLILRGDDVIDRSGPSAEGPYGVASPGDLILITLAHCLYETDRIRISDMRAVRKACSSPGLDWDSVSRAAEARGWSTGFRSALLIFAAFERALYTDPRIPSEIIVRSRVALGATRWARAPVARMESALEKGPVPAPLAISKVYSKMHTIERLLGEAERSPDARLADVCAMLWNLAANRLGLRCRPAVVIALSGLDGSGKSAVSTVLADAMRLCEVPVRVVWSRGGFSPWMEAVKKVARAPAVAPGPGDAEAKRRWLAGPVRGSLYSIAVLIEQAIVQAIRIRLPRRLGRSIVCDRSGIDNAVDLASKLGRRRLADGSAALAMAIGPSPDLAVLLRVSPETAMARKPGEEHRGLAGRARQYDDLAAALGILVLDAERPLAEVAGEVVDAGLRTAFSRFGGGAGRR